jgi:hypothetical protein
VDRATRASQLCGEKRDFIGLKPRLATGHNDDARTSREDVAKDFGSRN